MKKLPIALATTALTASLGAFAALPTDAQPFQVVVPNLKSGIDITLEGNYLQPSNSDLDYATLSTFNSNANTTINGNVDVKTVDPDYNFGFRVGLGYTFEDSGNDVQLSWTHFNHTDSDSANTPSQSVLTSLLGHFNIVNTQATAEENALAIKDFILDLGSEGLIYDEEHTSSDAKFKLDAVDLDVGQFVDIGTRLRMRMFAGLRVAQVENNQTTDLSAITDAEFSGARNQLFDNYKEIFYSKFTGIGPRFGIDSIYHIGNCFALVGHASVALLVGETKTNTTYEDFISAAVSRDGVVFQAQDQNSNIEIKSDNLNRVVPALDAKLGLDYSLVFENESILTIEGGYQVTHYIDAVDRLTADIDQFAGEGEESGPFASPVNAERTTSSVSFAGPYLSLNWKV